MFTHGFVGSCTFYFKTLARLANDYNLVMFDNCGRGMNTRLENCSGLESSEAAEKWLIDFMIKAIDALDLPEKFVMLGHSYGAYLCTLYAG